MSTDPKKPLSPEALDFYDGPYEDDANRPGWSPDFEKKMAEDMVEQMKRVAAIRAARHLARAIAIAAEAHAGQVDKAGAPYIFHPLRVMLAVSGKPHPAPIVAVLHDVLEDCPDWPAERLRKEGFGPDVMDALDALTRARGESYPEFVARAGRNPIARVVKLADLGDNMDLSRFGARELTEKDLERLERYRHAVEALNAPEA